ncbi:MAG: phospho-sugar mutase, partial [Duncaniella sp.]|nr:phospho-sugar mutase [Duncaniella sp.]
SLLAEACAWAMDKGMHFQAMLADIYCKYGFSMEVGVSVVRPGKTGAEEIQAMMKNFRENPPKTLAGAAVTEVKDYETLDLTKADGTKEKLNFPTTSNVLQWFTEDNSKISVRPSGTEPKIKFYMEVSVPMNSPEEYDAARVQASAKIEALKKDLGI